MNNDKLNKKLTTLCNEEYNRSLNKSNEDLNIKEKKELNEVVNLMKRINKKF